MDTDSYHSNHFVHRPKFPSNIVGRLFMKLQMFKSNLWHDFDMVFKDTFFENLKVTFRYCYIPLEQYFQILSIGMFSTRANSIVYFELVHECIEKIWSCANYWNKTSKKVHKNWANNWKFFLPLAAAEYCVLSSFSSAFVLALLLICEFVWTLGVVPTNIFMYLISWSELWHMA